MDPTSNDPVHVLTRHRPQGTRPEGARSAARPDHEQIQGCDVWHMVAQQGAPALTARAAVYLGHVLGDGRLSHREAEFEQLAMDARRAVCTENWIRLDARQRLGNPAT